MLKGFQSNSDVPGVEKLVITAVDDKWLTSKRFQIKPSDFHADGGFLSPQNVFTVKGFHRSCCGLLVILAAFEMVPIFEAGFKTNNSLKFCGSSMPSLLETHA